MENALLRLLPPPQQEMQLEGLYLAHDIRGIPAAGHPFIYASYITSLDGRIAVPDPASGRMSVPSQIANPRDWRLFQELAAQADILLTTGRYLRERGEGIGQEILHPYQDARFADLQQWRIESGLPSLPDVAVLSASLDFPLPEELMHAGRSFTLITTRHAPARRVIELQRAARAIIIAGEETIEGEQLVGGLAELGYRIIFNTAGPKVLHLLLASRFPQRLYLTITQRILGGDPFSPLVEGPSFDPPADFKLSALHYDPHALEGVGQLFAVFERA
jgi:riboflavin biosynthesis pyrimidine reductase